MTYNHDEFVAERKKKGAYRIEELADTRPSPTHKVYTGDSFYVEAFVI